MKRFGKAVMSSFGIVQVSALFLPPLTSIEMYMVRYAIIHIGLFLFLYPIFKDDPKEADRE